MLHTPFRTLCYIHGAWFCSISISNKLRMVIYFICIYIHNIYNCFYPWISDVAYVTSTVFTDGLCLIIGMGSKLHILCRPGKPCMLDLIFYHGTPLYQVYIPNHKIMQVCSRLCVWLSLRSSGPWIPTCPCMCALFMANLYTNWSGTSRNTIFNYIKIREKLLCERFAKRWTNKM